MRGASVMEKARNTMTPEQEAEWEQRVREGTLFGAPGVSASDVVVNIARYRWPDGRIPYGAQTELAKETGLHTSTINAALRKEGFSASVGWPGFSGRPADARVEGLGIPSPGTKAPRPPRTRREELIAEEKARLAANRPDSVREFLGGGA